MPGSRSNLEHTRKVGTFLWRAWWLAIRFTAIEIASVSEWITRFCNEGTSSFQSSRTPIIHRIAAFVVAYIIIGLVGVECTELSKIWVVRGWFGGTVFGARLVDTVGGSGFGRLEGHLDAISACDFGRTETFNFLAVEQTSPTIGTVKDESARFIGGSTWVWDGTGSGEVVHLAGNRRSIRMCCTGVSIKTVPVNGDGIPVILILGSVTNVDPLTR